MQPDERVVVLGWGYQAGKAASEETLRGAGEKDLVVIPAAVAWELLCDRSNAHPCSLSKVRMLPLKYSRGHA